MDKLMLCECSFSVAFFVPQGWVCATFNVLALFFVVFWVYFGGLGYDVVENIVLLLTLRGVQ